MKRTTGLVQVLMVFVLCLAGMAGAADAMEYKGYINKTFGYSLPPWWTSTRKQAMGPSSKNHG